MQQPKRAEHSPPPPRPLAALPTRKHLFGITGPVGSKPFWPPWRSRGLSLTPPTRPASTARRPISTGRSHLGSIACGMRRSNAHATWRKEAFTRGVIGWHEPVFFGGECIGHVPKKSDRCLELYLKAHDPAYRDKVDLTHAAPDGGPVRTQAEITAQLAPYESAVAMMIDAAIALRALEAAPPSSLSTPAGPEVIDVEAVRSPAARRRPGRQALPSGRQAGREPLLPHLPRARRLAWKVDVNRRRGKGLNAAREFYFFDRQRHLFGARRSWCRVARFADLGTAKIVVNNYRAFKARERGGAGNLTKTMLTGGNCGTFAQSPAQVVRRVCCELGARWRTSSCSTMKPTTATALSRRRKWRS